MRRLPALGVASLQMGSRREVARDQLALVPPDETSASRAPRRRASGHPRRDCLGRTAGARTRRRPASASLDQGRGVLSGARRSARGANVGVGRNALGASSRAAHGRCRKPMRPLSRASSRRIPAGSDDCSSSFASMSDATAAALALARVGQWAPTTSRPRVPAPRRSAPGHATRSPL